MSEPNKPHPQIEKRKKRVLTDSRKTQNRLAQRAYRQRQKELTKNSSGSKQLPVRLHELRPRQPRQPHDVERRCGEEEVSSDATPTTITVLHGSTEQENTTSQSDVGIDSEQMDSLQDSVPTNSESVLWLDAEDIDPTEIYPATLSTARFISDVDSTVTRTAVPWFGTLGIPFADFGDPSSIGNDTSLSMVNPSLPQSESHAIPSYRNTDIQNAVPEEQLIFSSPSSTSLYSNGPGYSSQTYQASPVPFIEEIPAAGTISLQDLIPQPTTSTTTLSTSHQRHPFPPSIPSPYLNLLTPYQTSIIRAFIHNAHALSIPPSSLLTNLPLSPFYNATITPSSSPHELFSSLPKPRAEYPPHLRPTIEQVLWKHHAYLDLLPFEGLRGRGVSWARQNVRVSGPVTSGEDTGGVGRGEGMGLFDPWELKMDIVMGGLVCGGVCGVGTGYVGVRGAEGGEGQPWDRRSWRVAGWFGRKWRLLLC
ncbi:hypothetical protein BKA65DRAFT_571421 [Rhexocercosporidium sp. MPI-PUGE-AT-0058]|nr:hypothetical protein BKA65DRAFT_571421 [Rhexocercosporidium sp. MPI-PUGE-AT-0058]